MSQPLKRQLITTKDGSKTLYIPELNENYHSVNGAIQESMHVFINTGLALLYNLPEIKILEIGFGTGLNALLTAKYKKDSSITYHSIEKYPLNPEELMALNYTSLLDEPEIWQDLFNNMHTCPWETLQKIENGFNIYKTNVALKDYQSEERFNLVYFDAFAPDIQPDLWTAEVFQKIFTMMESKGILVTYCAKGQVRRNMQAAGFNVERLPGPPGKREMLRAIKD